MTNPIRFVTELDGIPASKLSGFFVGWPNPPGHDQFMRLLQGSSHIVLAIDDDADGRVVGFITAISDGVLSAYIPLLEVLPEWQHRGIGSDLVQRMLDQLEPLYMIDLCCDDEMMPFYDRFGFTRGRAMLKRSYPHQAGRAIDGGTHTDD